MWIDYAGPDEDRIQYGQVIAHPSWFEIPHAVELRQTFGAIGRRVFRHQSDPAPPCQWINVIRDITGDLAKRRQIGTDNRYTKRQRFCQRESESLDMGWEQGERQLPDDASFDQRPRTSAGARGR